MEKDDIENMTLIFSLSILGIDFIANIFKDTLTL